MEVRQRRERGCGLFLSCENQIFLKLPQQWLAEKAATAMTGRGHSRLHTQFNPSQSSWHHINQAFISMDPKKLYFHSPTPNWGKAKPLPANSRDREAPEQTGVAPPTALTHRHTLDRPFGRSGFTRTSSEIPHRRDVSTAQARLHVSATFQRVWNNRALFLKYKMKQDDFFRSEISIYVWAKWIKNKKNSVGMINKDLHSCTMEPLRGQADGKKYRRIWEECVFKCYFYEQMQSFCRTGQFLRAKVECKRFGRECENIET